MTKQQGNFLICRPLAEEEQDFFNGHIGRLRRDYGLTNIYHARDMSLVTVWPNEYQRFSQRSAALRALGDRAIAKTLNDGVLRGRPKISLETTGVHFVKASRDDSWYVSYRLRLPPRLINERQLATAELNRLAAAELPWDGGLHPELRVAVVSKQARHNETLAIFEGLRPAKTCVLPPVVLLDGMLP